jgi:FkbM family methyltransferase
MSFRGAARSTLLAVDRLLGVRRWLREEEPPARASADPFCVSDLRHPVPRTVLDIGGSHGQFAREAMRAFPGVRIHSFEPIPECFSELQDLARTHPSLLPHRLALSDFDGEKEFRVSRFRDSSSFQEMLPAHEEAWPHTALEATITVPVARLDAVADSLALEEPLFAKIDVQGHELAVIAGGRATLARCQRVLIECNFAPLYAGQASFSELRRQLCGLGLLFEGFLSPLRHPRTAELLSADLLFFRNESPAGSNAGGPGTESR